MKYIETEIEDSTGYVIPLGDIHVGNKSFEKVGLPKLKETLGFISDNNCKVFLNGDIFDVASRSSKTSPFEFDTSEFEKAIKILSPIKDKIIGAVDGNHEHRLIDDYGISITQLLCRELQIPYCGYSAVVRFKVGKRKDKGSDGRFMQNYFGYFHHSTGGGGSIGSKLNRAVRMGDIVEGCDFICASHNHQLSVAPQEVYYPSIQEKDVKKKTIWYITCGSYLEWNEEYGEKAMYTPTRIGSPTIALDGRENHHDIRVQI